MAKEYVEEREGGYFVRGSRVSLDSLVYAFLRGESPEGIAESFPAITLEQVLGALAFYLANLEAVDIICGRKEPNSHGCRKNPDVSTRNFTGNWKLLGARLQSPDGETRFQADADFNRKVVLVSGGATEPSIFRTQTLPELSAHRIRRSFARRQMTHESWSPMIAKRCRGISHDSWRTIQVRG